MHSVGLLAYGETGLTPLTNGGSPLLRNVCFLASSSQHALRGTTTVNQYIGEVGAKIESREVLQSQFLRGPMLLAGRQQGDSKSRVPRMPMYDPLSRSRNSRLVAVSPAEPCKAPLTSLHPLLLLAVASATQPRYTISL